MKRRAFLLGSTSILGLTALPADAFKSNLVINDLVPIITWARPVDRQW